MESYLQGRGTYEWADGRKYEGEWVKDEMHGSGVYTWPDKRKYVGEFQKGKKLRERTQHTKELKKAEDDEHNMDEEIVNMINKLKKIEN